MSEAWDRCDGEDLLDRDAPEPVIVWLCRFCAKHEGPPNSGISKQGYCESCDSRTMLMEYSL